MVLGDGKDGRTTEAGATAPDADVAAAAQARGFGQLVACRDLGDPLKNALVYWAAAVAAWAFLLLMSFVFASTGWLKDSPFEVVLAAVVMVLAFGGLAGFVAGIKTLVRGRQAWHVYENGFVARTGSKVWAFPWQEAVSFKPAGETATTVKARAHTVPIAGAGEAVPLYALTGPGGRRLLIHSEVTDGRDVFVDALTAALQRFGRPVG